MLKLLKQLIDSNDREVQRAKRVVEQINALEPQMMETSFDDMKKRIAEMRGELGLLVDKIPQESRTSLKSIDKNKGLPEYERAIQEKLLSFLPEVYAMIREVMRRDFDRRHFDVQLLAGVLLAQGQKLVEVKTGEGKTQIFHLPLFLYSLVGRGAHMVTVNEYLARRDGEYAGHVASRLGISVGVITPGNRSYMYIPDTEVQEKKGKEAFEELPVGVKPTIAGMQGLNLLEVSKKDAYNCDVTYGINNEFGFDYLRDNMAWELSQRVQGELYFCVVDEADSILIDEARTPLIISAVPEDTDTDKYFRFANAVKNLEEGKDYTVDYKSKSVMLTEEGIQSSEKALGVDNLWSDYSFAHHLENALKAKALFLKDDQYIIRNGEILIVDSFTGRVLPGRRYSEGLHQAIEAKEGVEVQKESQTYASITFQNYFRLYKVLCGGSGTIITEAEEFFQIYGLESVAIPTNKPVVRQDLPDLIYRDEESKFNAVVEEIKERHEKGQPVLVGTTSVERSEKLSRLLDEQQIPHSVLNAKYHEQEAHIVAHAGEKGAVTVATNMAGRGTDIPLEGGVKELGGLAVIGTERHEARRIDNQLRGRSGRQGDPGVSRFYVALDDQIMKVLGGDLLSRSVGKIMDSSAPIELSLISRQIETAQKRIEWANFDSRKNVVDYDDVMTRHREVFYTRRYKLLELTEKALGRYWLVNEDKNSKSFSDEEKETMKTDALLELKDQISEMVRLEIDSLVDGQFYQDKVLNEEGLETLANHILGLAPDIQLAGVFSFKLTELKEGIKKEMRNRDSAWVKEYLNTGFKKLLKAKEEEFASEYAMVIKALLFEAMDKLWMEHLETMADVRSGIGLQSYAQRNPLVEYKNIAYTEFEGLMDRIDTSVVNRLFKVARVERRESKKLDTNVEDVKDIDIGDREMNVGNDKLKDMVDKIAGSAKKRQAQADAASGKALAVHKKKVGRNDPCPCGSGKKYKKCHYPEFG